MRKLVSVLILALAASSAVAETATEQEALNMARNWVTRVIAGFGSWGGSAEARVVGIQPFMRGDRQLGYFCPVEPRGYLVVSLHKELAPVKAYSETDSLDPASDEGMADVIKIGLERMIEAAESIVGKMTAPAATDLSSIVEIDYKPVWSKMAVDPAVYNAQIAREPLGANYQAFQVLLTSAWHQYWPYNDQCPNLGCTQPGTNGRALVGCVATAAAQIMRHWGWPPYGVGGSYTDPYDWANMPNTISGSSSPAEIDAVAELGHEVGVACDMQYGCEGSGAYHTDMVYAYENNFRYSTLAIIRQRKDYTAVQWFERMKTQFNVNRPVHYGIPGHSLVGDGWREYGDPLIREYHFNYGWRATSYNTWYVLDALHGGNPDEEEMIENIKPAPSMGASVSGTYTVPAFPYRYFDQDAVCSTAAAFNAGHNLQLLHNVTLTCSSTTGYLYIYGTSSSNTRIFSRGDQSRGALISGTAAIRMSSGGTVVFR